MPARALGRGVRTGPMIPRGRMRDPLRRRDITGRATAPNRVVRFGAHAGARELLIQMALLDFIIPNDSTKELESVTGAIRRDYVAEHGFIAVPIEPEYLRGCTDMAKFLNGEDL